MIKLPSPLDKDWESRKYGRVGDRRRILSDRGLRQAINAGLMSFTPALDLSDDCRIQPVTIDLKFKEVEGLEPLSRGFGDCISRGPVLLPGQRSTVVLTEQIEFEPGRQSDYTTDRELSVRGFDGRYLLPSIEARSSLRRLGCFVCPPNIVFNSADGLQFDVGNFGPNPVQLSYGDRFAQMFVFVEPYQDVAPTLEHLFDGCKETERGSLVRSLDMGVEVSTRREFALLVKEGYLSVSPNAEFRGGRLVVHASNVAYRMKKLDKPIDFNKRDELGDVVEPIDICRGYRVENRDHVVVETVEQLKLSPHVAIRFWDNLYGFTGEPVDRSFAHLASFADGLRNLSVIGLTDGLVDPGYEGGFSRQPKWLTGRVIHPGDILGFGQVFFFPNGVERPYGSKVLGSQYQGKERTVFSK
ncbi:hypothetical protein COV18_01185 [Candidatus Woesearchaeota archaeon CG10_big_fil_rev_8_21_14_0_10_37_12]|nr:MAG: hypothetical protein COV18_01185 [Candidatus Woesearchaeota archaeon CG10_big_fil_rev_8_21_14_0_10_37_12]